MTEQVSLDYIIIPSELGKRETNFKNQNLLRKRKSMVRHSVYFL